MRIVRAERLEGRDSQNVLFQSVVVIELGGIVVGASRELVANTYNIAIVCAYDLRIV